MKRSELRAKVIERSGGWCQWPGCPNRGTEMAHLHSVGMGGRQSADTLENVMWSCWDHARITDGEFGHGGAEQYDAEHRKLLGFDNHLDNARGYLAYRRAEALAAHLKQ